MTRGKACFVAGKDLPIVTARYAWLASIVLVSAVAAAASAQGTSSGPFAGVDVVRLVLNTPGVSRNAALSTGTSVYVTIDGTPYGGVIAPGRATSGQTIDGDWLLAVPLETSTPERAYVALVYRSTGGVPEYVAAVDSKRGQLEVSVHDGHLFVTAPLYARRDLPCCPSAKVVERLLYSAAVDGLISVTRQTINLSKPPASPPPAAK
jgi:hypothetical protein